MRSAIAHILGVAVVIATCGAGSEAISRAFTVMVPADRSADVISRAFTIVGPAKPIQETVSRPITVTSCPWDYNGDAIVGIEDLLALLEAWGPSLGHPSDFDEDGEIGILDLLKLLFNWGACGSVAPHTC